MLHGMESTLERKLPASDRRWEVDENARKYGSVTELRPSRWPTDTSPLPDHLNPLA